VVHIGTRRGEQCRATLSAEGRTCDVDPLSWSVAGSATGLVVIADSARSLQQASCWMPGRILVLTEACACLDEARSILVDPSALGFAGIVLLADDESALALEQGAGRDDGPPRPTTTVPVVLVTRAQDQECVRHAVRITVEVHDTPVSAPTVPGPRHHRRRRALVPWHAADGTHRVPGTIDLRHR
jgi:hypothetical protein